jgi:hypothetical protein
MEKFKNALKSVNKLGLVAIAVVAVATMAFTPAKNLATKKYSYDPSAPAGSKWTDVTSLQQTSGGVTRDYRCSGTENTCTAEFDVNPNINPSAIPSNEVEGNFVLED